MPRLLYQGHASLRLTTNDARVVYVDPYAGEGYDLPADLILVTHNHRDHNRVDRCARKPGCRVITAQEALAGGIHQRYDIGGIGVEAVTARNLLHHPSRCVGYLITVDGVRLYVSGDTSTTAQMATFAALGLDYALLCGDGLFNMGAREAATCARTIAAKHNILIHTKPGALWDRAKVERWTAPNKLVVEPGQEIAL